MVYFVTLIVLFNYFHVEELDVKSVLQRLPFVVF